MADPTTPLQLIYFSQPKCSVCISLKQKVKALINDRYSQLSFEEIDISINPEKGVQFMIFSSPVIIILFEKKEVYRKAGNMSLLDLEKDITRLIGLIN